MKRFKQSIAIGLAGAMLLALAACGQQNAQPSSNSSAQEPPAESSQQTQQPAESSAPASSGPAEGTENEEGAEGGKVLVAYYSATGNTQAVAEYIAGATGGDLFEIVPAEPYTSEDLNWTNADSRVSREHDDESLRAVELTTATVDNWDEYDTVFIGYPIWWGIAAWPVNGFVEANDFTGKTVIPFCTSTSSSLGQSGDLLEDLAGTGNWLEGRRFSERPSQSDVQSWVSSLDL